MRSGRILAAAIVVAALTAAPYGFQAPASTDAPEYGPAKGTLLIVGGGNLNGSGINEKFIELAGGKDKNFVIVPTAGGNRNADGSLIVYKEEDVVAPWVKLGLTHVRMLHTADPKVADTDAFAKVLSDANAVWFNGGRQWNVVYSYANTLTYRDPYKVLERGGVIGGSSSAGRRSRGTISSAATPPART
jgi:cyanophycinase